MEIDQTTLACRLITIFVCETVCIYTPEVQEKQKSGINKIYNTVNLVCELRRKRENKGL